MNNTPSKINIRQKEERIWSWIKQRLSLLDSSFSKLAKLHGVTRQNFAIVKHHPYPKYETLIAKKLGLNPLDLWPSRYDANNNPNRGRARYNTQNRVKHNGKNNQKFISESTE